MASNQPPETISLSGDNWFIHGDAAGAGEDDALYAADLGAPGWIPATVPGNIQADLEAAHRLKPLWYGAGDPRLAEVAYKDWWYRRDFDLPDAVSGARIQLIFDGVDYACDVWLNGRRLGSHAGMFRRFAFDVADIVKPGETNRLAIKIERMPPELAHILAASDGAMSGGGENYPREWGPDFFVNGINQTRQLFKDLKSPTNYGWDWGVNIYTLGIWQDVRLEVTGPARIDWLRALADLSGDHRQARINASIEVDSLDAVNVRAAFRVTGQGVRLDATVKASLRPGSNAIEAELLLEDPALWWPNGHGDQPLYTLEARLVDSHSGQLLDQRSTRFGIRDIRWEQVEGAPPNFINPYQLVVNGRPLRMLGSNILPPDLLFGRIDERGPRLMRLAHLAGINTQRIWGGGVLLSERMFELADELGIMISLEFPMSSCKPETDEVFLGNLEITATQLVRRYRNHPSIIEYTGGNEMWWLQGEDHPALHLFNRVVAENDDRLFRATCPIQGSRHSPWHYDPDTHYAHYDDEDMRDSGMNRGQNKMMRYGEFGCHTLAHLEVWRREIPPDDQWPPDDVHNPVLIRKNVAQAVFTKEHWLLKPILDALFGPIDSLEALIEAGQFIGAHGLRYAVDALRRRGKRLGGLTTWVFNEPWPNGGGPYLVDYDGRPLMNYDFLKQALAPISLSLRCASNVFDPRTGLDAQLWLVSDAPQPQDELRWRWLLRDLSGRILAQNQGQAAIQPRQALHIDVISTGALERAAERILLVELQLLDSGGQLLSERLHLFGSNGASAPFAGLVAGHATDDYPVAPAALQAEVRARQSDGNIDSLQIALTNTGAMTALFCEPHPSLSYRTDIDIDNNHAFIPPGETRVITISAPAASDKELTLTQTGWRISCWNADDLMIAPGQDLLFSIGRRDAMNEEFQRISDTSPISDKLDLTITGNRPDPSALPYLMTGDGRVRVHFDIAGGWRQPSRLRLHTADQDSQRAVQLLVNVNGNRFAGALPTGLGIQKREPAHLAFPQTAEFHLPAGTLQQGPNVLEIQVSNAAWFTWDAIDLTISERPAP